MQGELGTSHAYEAGGDHRRPPQVALGYLAAEVKLVPEDGSYEITRIVTGDAWDAGADSPLNAVGVEAKVGERIVAVNGQRTSKSRPPHSLLVHQAGTKVELRLASGEGASASTRDVLVTTLADEVPARYREWVERNRAWVHEHSEGRVGYLHLPDMMSAGFAEFHRYFASECDRDGLIVDVRYNRGGHVSELLLEKVARKRIGYNFSRWCPPQSYPEDRGRGSGGRADQRACRFRRRHLLPRLQAHGPRTARRNTDLGRGDRHLAAAQAGRRVGDVADRSSRSGSTTSAGASRTTAPIRRSRSTMRRRTPRPVAIVSSNAPWLPPSSSSNGPASSSRSSTTDRGWRERSCRRERPAVDCSARKSAPRDGSRVRARDPCKLVADVRGARPSSGRARAFRFAGSRRRATGHDRGAAVPTRAAPMRPNARRP